MMRVCNVAEGCPSVKACWHSKPHQYEDKVNERLCLSEHCPLYGHLTATCIPIGDEEDIT
jgi:hypothetical protein